MRTLFVGGLLVSLAQVVKDQVGVMYKIISAEDAESSLRLQEKLSESGKMLHVYVWDGEITILTNFSRVEEAERFLAEKYGIEICHDALRCVA